MNQFKLGDTVMWTSQSAGITRTKIGKVVEVIDKMRSPTGVRNPGLPRDHESYLVRASALRDSDDGRKRTRLYWPRVSLLVSYKGEL